MRPQFVSMAAVVAASCIAASWPHSSSTSILCHARTSTATSAVTASILALLLHSADAMSGRRSMWRRDGRRAFMRDGESCAAPAAVCCSLKYWRGQEAMLESPRAEPVGDADGDAGYELVGDAERAARSVGVRLAGDAETVMVPFR